TGPVLLGVEQTRTTPGMVLLKGHRALARVHRTGEVLELRHGVLPRSQVIGVCGGGLLRVRSHHEGRQRRYQQSERARNGPATARSVVPFGGRSRAPGVGEPWGPGSGGGAPSVRLRTFAIFGCLVSELQEKFLGGVCCGASRSPNGWKASGSRTRCSRLFWPTHCF